MYSSKYLHIIICKNDMQLCVQMSSATDSPDWIYRFWNIKFGHDLHILTINVLRYVFVWKYFFSFFCIQYLWLL